MDIKPMNIIASVTAVLGLIGGIIAFDARYAKQDILDKAMDRVVNEMRQEVVKNRAVMIDGMQRDADDIEYQISRLEADGKPIPRYLSDKYKQIVRQIENLKNEKNNN